MSNVNAPLVSFRETVARLELSPLYLIDPTSLASALLGRLRLATKYISKAADVSRSRAYEVLSRSGSFGDWHHLNQHISSPVGASYAATPQWFEALTPLLPLLIRQHSETAPRPEAIRIVELFWRRTAAELDIPSAGILDRVGAQMLGERSWAALLARSPLKASDPFYRFVLPPSSIAGQFQLSPAGYALFDELSALSDLGRDPTEEELIEARNWATKIAHRRPDFLDAGLFLAELAAADDIAIAGSILDTYIARAEALIPAGYAGLVEWEPEGNRVYLRMLRLRMELARDTADLTRAIKLAKKILKLCPDDNLGIRHHLPILHLTKGNVASASRALSAIAKESGDATTSAIRAFVAYASGDVASYRANILETLFYWPTFRTFVQGSAADFPMGETGLRRQNIDLVEFVGLVWPAYVSVEGLKEATLTLVNGARVLEAEAHLRTLWYGFWHNPAPTNTLDQWEQAIARYTRGSA